LSRVFTRNISGLGNDDGLPRDRHDIVMDRQLSTLNFQRLKGKGTRIMGPETGSSIPISAALNFAVWSQAAGKRQDNENLQSGSTR
jgi:hypothetical protein